MSTIENRYDFVFFSTARTATRTGIRTPTTARASIPRPFRDLSPMCA